jgi:LmbE family N-acetylglucosaminyl deacetylase
VFAHPDDESLACGGLLAWCAERGAAVSLLCLTQGEGGPGAEGTRSLQETRAGELRDAARILGIGNLTLLNYPDGMLPWVDQEALEADIRDVIARVHPDVVITFGEDGLYWHPDHIAVHERTTAAVAGLDPAGCRPVLYYVTMPPGAMRGVVDHTTRTVAVQSVQGRLPQSIFGIEDADAFGADASLPTLVIDVSAFAARKLAAIKCHRSQLAGSALALVEERDAARLLGVEHFRRADVASAADAFIERLSGVA